MPYFAEFNWQNSQGDLMKSRVQVLKFGGTSVGNGDCILRVAQIVAQTYKDPDAAFPIVVVSAMANVTDQLLRIANYAWLGEYNELERELEVLKQRHLATVEKAVHTYDGRTAVKDMLGNAFNGLERDIALVSDQSASASASKRRSLRSFTDAIAAWGERLSVLLVAASVAAAGIPTAPLREEVIITTQPDDDVTQGQEATLVIGGVPLQEETRTNAQRLIYPLLEQGIIPIAAGFIGRTTTGTITTLGRNGSDYSASVIGSALDCVEVSIYTDVDGVLSADPRIVMNTRLLPRLSYAEAARLSWFGAQVLHPRTLIPIAHRNIPVRVRNTFQPQNRGTLIVPDSRSPSGAGAIAVRRHLSLVTVESTDLCGVPENTGQVFELAARAGTAPVAICSSSGHHLSFVVEEQAEESVVAFLRREMGEMGTIASPGESTWRVRSRGGLAACACIGSGFTVDPMSPARAITALARERIPVITQGDSDIGITLIVEDRDSERALRSLHRDLIAPVIPLVRHTHTTMEQQREVCGV
jgi:aspartate kinase